MKCTKCNLHKYNTIQFKPERIIGVKIKLAFIFNYSYEDPTPKLIGKPATVFNYLLAKLRIKRKEVVLIPNIWCPVQTPEGVGRMPFLPEYLMCIDNVYKYLNRINPFLIIYVGKDTKKYCDEFNQETYTMIDFDSIVKAGGVFSSRFEELALDLERYLS